MNMQSDKQALKIAFVVPPLTGHVNPTIAVAQSLKASGHQVCWIGHERLDAWLPEDSELIPVSLSEDFFVPFDKHSHKVRGLESVKFFFEQFAIPLAVETYPQVEAIVRDIKPDLLLVDQQMVSGALVARKLELPWLTFATTSASLIKQQGNFEQWFTDQFHDLQRKCEFTPMLDRPEISPHGVVVFSSHQLVGLGSDLYDASYHFVGPTIRAQDTQDNFPWDKLDSNKKKILVSLGTVSRDRTASYYTAMMEALADEDIQVIMSAPEAMAEQAPDNFIVMPRVPQVTLLPHLDAVVTHAGHNTVCETLFNGLPMVVSPIRDDQPVIAQQVVDAGAGVFLRFGRASAKMARQAVLDVLNNPEYKSNAEKIQSSFKSLGGAAAVTDLIETQFNTRREAV